MPARGRKLAPIRSDLGAPRRAPLRARIRSCPAARICRRTVVEYRNLGKDGPKVSAIGFGCWEMGGQHYGGTDDAEVTAAVHRAIDLGVTLFDTAPNYGFGGSEEVLGRALKGRRDKVVLVSKTCISWDPVTYTSKIDGRYSTTRRLHEERLKRLGVDYLDLLLIHWPDPETPIEETMRALNDIRQAGTARYVGVSNYT